MSWPMLTYFYFSIPIRKPLFLPLYFFNFVLQEPLELMEDLIGLQKQLPDNICVIIPTYNNSKTIGAVIKKVMAYTQHILVVNDGSTDDTLEVLKNLETIHSIAYEKNKGKGMALRKGLQWAAAQSFEYAITIDSDGQHFPEDLTLFLKTIQENPNSLIVGSRNIQADGMPGKNSFANKFSNFWFRLETGIDLPDTQSGFRLYPVEALAHKKYFTSKYEFELEILVRAAWQGIPIHPIPVQVYYPPEEERVSHFRPLPDFSRISVLNTVLVFLTLIYILPRKAYRYIRDNSLKDVVIQQLSLHNESPFKMAAGIGFGIFMGFAPIWGFQMLTAAFLAHLLKLNKIVVLAASNISLPPLIPFIIYFSYRMGALFMENPRSIDAEKLAELKDQVMQGKFYDTLQSLGYDVFQYILGSLSLGVSLGTAVFLVAFVIFKFTLPSNKTEA